MQGKLRVFVWGTVLAAAGGASWFLSGQSSNDPRLWQDRNLGKAFYENPTTHAEAVTELKKALDLAPDSPRDQLNYGLALLRQGDNDAAMAELLKVQKEDPKLPHTWFNLGILYKKNNDPDKALAQFQEMVRLVPNEPVSHYQLGVLYKMKEDYPDAIKQFEIARDLSPRLGAPHYQLYGLYRQAGRPDRADAELKIFQQLKKDQEGAAIPEDMEWCAYAELYDPIDVAPGAPPPAPTYRDEKIADGFTGADAGVASMAGPDGHPDLIAWSANRVAWFSAGRTLVPESGLESLRGVQFIAPGDFNNDGLPDLCIVTAKGAALYRNTGKAFVKQADLAMGSFRKAVWLDFDHDYDEDIVLIGDDSRLVRNNGEAGFSDETKRFPFVAGKALDAVRFDLEPDTPGFDLVVSYADRPGELYRDQLGGNYRAVALDVLKAGTKGLVGDDFNHDGFTDLIADGATLVNRQGKLETAPVRTAPSPDGAADFTGNGRLDYAHIDSHGDLLMARDDTKDYGNWIEVGLIGVKNNKLSVNAKVEVKAGATYRKMTYAGVPLVFRLGNAASVDTVRITWANGLIQNEMKQPVNKVDTITEAPRLAGSCPMIFTWNGGRFQFLTDVLGVAPLGASSGDGQFFPVDHQEWVSIPAEALQARDGAYQLRMTEELREVSYIDQIELLALDHPAGTEIVTNEKFKSPPFPEFRLYGGTHRVYPTAAHDSHGKDVRAALLARDQRYPDDFQRDHAGVAELHTLDLDFAGAARDGKATLVLQGWVDWADGSTFLAATQAHRDLVFPYLQMKDAQGKWKTVIDDMGMPSGKPKPMAVDLTGKWLSASREVRIVTSLCVYWDEIYLYENDTPPQTRLTAIPMSTADLHFRGFSHATIDRDRKQPESFDYQAVSPTTMWNPTPGNYTRYGAVADLLRQPDDRMVVMGSGDEIRMQFPASGLPALPSGWRRDFLLLVGGWAKDADANTAFSQSVMPLPFHAMSRYPYPANEHFPDDAAHREYVRDYLTRPALRLLRPLLDGTR
ncbi:MAG TPA: tetratricopeptide repeat protein [Bryobacteraceae bacterium]|jgi:tetratricopeptide (TPR) repeat protein|nr:tetratricopeptide repeat protein [Bryobacteraceae bacterium]